MWLVVSVENRLGLWRKIKTKLFADEDRAVRYCMRRNNRTLFEVGDMYEFVCKPIEEEEEEEKEPFQLGFCHVEHEE